MDEQQRKIGLALGGGGGKGSAHIGVLGVLEDLHVPIDVLTGTSIGALVAALYAVGYGPDEIAGWFEYGANNHAWGPDRTRTGLIGTGSLAALLREALGARTFADTRMPLALVVVDLHRGREVILRDGSLVDAVLASTALPVIFPPVVRGDEVLVDGGVLNNIPVDVAQSLGAGRVIAVDLGIVPDTWTLTSPKKVSRPKPLRARLRARLMPRPPLEIAERALMILTSRLSQLALAQTPPAILLQPDVGSVHLLDFEQTPIGRRSGEWAALEQRAVLEALRSWRGGMPPGDTGSVPVPDTINRKENGE